MELRDLRGDDLFKILPIIGKLDVKDDMISVMSAGVGEGFAQEQGIKVMVTVVQKALLNLPLIQDDLNSLLADLTGTSIKDIKKLGAVEYTKLVVTLFKKPEIKEVFTSAASLLGMTDSTD